MHTMNHSGKLYHIYEAETKQFSFSHPNLHPTFLSNFVICQTTKIASNI